MINGEVSFHLHAIGANRKTRPALDGDLDTDICIVGAGYTGLWAAWWLKEAMPDIAITVIDANYVGFGASGRNLGWLSGKPVGNKVRLATGPSGADGPKDLRRACIEAIYEIPMLMARHGIDIDAHNGGFLQVARTSAGLARLEKQISERESWGLGSEDMRLLGRDETVGRIHIPGAIGAISSPHCMRVQPAKLVAGLARMVEERGVTILECTTAQEIRPGLVRTTGGEIRAAFVLRALESYNSRFKGAERSIIPMRSTAVVTAPLSEAEWREIGWANAEGISGAEHLPFFSSRTADGRIIMAGGSFFPYRYASALDDNGAIDARRIRELASILKSLFPTVDFTIDHAWCGPFGLPRDWTPSVGFDRSTGLAHASGYVGQGVGASYVAGRTLADLIAGRESRWTRLPWVNRKSPDWEPEPVRWIGARAVYHLYDAADRIEARSGSPRTSVFAKLAATLNGR